MMNEAIGANATKLRPEVPRLVSEFEAEGQNLSSSIDDTFKLFYELKERLGNVLKSPKPEELVDGVNRRISPDSNIGNFVRDQANKVEQINNEIRELIERLAV